jgi:hypothetical protein
MDAKLYRWNSKTIKAISDGIRLAMSKKDIPKEGDRNEI